MAQLIPDKNLWVVTSALRPNMGAISEQDRFNQTIDTLKSLRKHCPNDLIYFTDGSPNPIAEDIIGKISPYCDFIACWNNDPDWHQDKEKVSLKLSYCLKPYLV
jgi:protein tyrosine/serine phosphatase